MEGEPLSRWGNRSRFGAVVAEAIELQGAAAVDLTQSSDRVEVRATWQDRPLLATGQRMLLESSVGYGAVAPFYLRLDLGHVSGPPSRWGILRSGKVTMQLAAAPEWLSLAAPIAPDGSYAQMVERVIEVAARLLPESMSTAMDEGAWPWDTLRDAGLRGGRRLTYGGAGLVSASAIATAAAALLPELAGPATIVMAAAPLGVAMLGIGIVRRRTLLRAHRRTLLRAHRRGKETMKALRATRLVERIAEARPGEEVWPPVVVPGERGVANLRAATTRTLLLVGTSARDRLVLRVKLHRIDYPVGSPDWSCLLPPAWATVALEGKKGTLERIPAGPRERREAERALWIFDEEELEGGKLPEHLRLVAQALEEAPHGPYR